MRLFNLIEINWAQPRNVEKPKVGKIYVNARYHNSRDSFYGPVLTMGLAHRYFLECDHSEYAVSYGYYHSDGRLYARKR